MFTVVVTSKEISKEQHITYLNKYGVNAKGVLVREVAGNAGSIVFVGKYEVENQTYEFLVIVLLLKTTKP